MNLQDVKRTTEFALNLDKPRTIKFDLNAFALLEEEYGSIGAAMEALEGGSIKAIRTVLWAGLVHEEMDEDFNPKISKAYVGSLLTMDMLGECTKALMQAFTMDTQTDAFIKEKIDNLAALNKDPQHLKV